MATYPPAPSPGEEEKGPARQRLNLEMEATALPLPSTLSSDESLTEARLTLNPTVHPEPVEDGEVQLVGAGANFPSFTIETSSLS